MEETKPKEYTPQEIEAMQFSELRDLAKQRNIDFVGLTPKQLKFKLGGAPEGAVVFDLKEGLSDEILRQREEKRERIPTKIIYPKELEDQIWRTREYNPDAFDGVDFTDRNAQMQHVFNKRTKCVCGDTIVMERRYKKRQDKKEIEVVDSTPIYKKQCTCGRWYMYHPKEDVEIHPK